MKVKVFDTQEQNEFELEAEYFLRIHKAFPIRFRPADKISEKLLLDVNPEDIDIGTTKSDEEKWKKSFEQAKEKERVDRLSKVVAEKLAIITNKFTNKNTSASEQSPSAQVQNPEKDNLVEFPENNWNKKELDQMDMSQLVAIFNEIYPNKKVPKSKKEIIAEILK